MNIEWKFWKKPRIGNNCIIFIRNTAHISKGKPCRRHWGNNPRFSCFSASKGKKQEMHLDKLPIYQKTQCEKGPAVRNPSHLVLTRVRFVIILHARAEPKQLAIIFFHFVKMLPLLATISLNPQRLWALGNLSNPLDFIITSPLKI
jgi:hypothetical protein